MGLQGEEIKGAVEPGGHDPERQERLPGGSPSEPLAVGLSAMSLDRPIPPAGEPWGREGLSQDGSTGAGTRCRAGGPWPQRRRHPLGLRCFICEMGTNVCLVGAQGVNELMTRMKWYLGNIMSMTGNSESGGGESPLHSPEPQERLQWREQLRRGCEEPQRHCCPMTEGQLQHECCLLRLLFPHRNKDSAHCLGVLGTG